MVSPEMTSLSSSCLNDFQQQSDLSLCSASNYDRYKGEGSDVQFKYLDFEAATEGEYWLIFRGFLLLHRDAAAGRFAVHRTAGIGSHVNRLELKQREQADLDVQNTLHQGKGRTLRALRAT